MSAKLPDYYAVLHVHPSAPTEVIRASYRALMQKLRAHPDLGGEHEAAAELNAAWSVLKNRDRRAWYDEQLAGPGHSGKPQRSQARQPPAPRPKARQRPAPRGDTYGARGVLENVTQAPSCADICPFCGVAATSSSGGEAADVCRGCEAPLTIVQPVSGRNSATERSVYRIASSAVVRVFTDPQDRTGCEAAVQDISVTGMRISCRESLSAGSLIRIDSEFCAAVARIAHIDRSEDEENQYGAQFLTVRFKQQRGSLLSVPA